MICVEISFRTCKWYWYVHCVYVSHLGSAVRHPTSFICIVLREQAGVFVVIGSAVSTVHMPVVLLVHLALTQERRSEFWQKFDGIARGRRVKSSRQGWVKWQCQTWYSARIWHGMSWCRERMKTEVFTRQAGYEGYSAVRRQRRPDVPLPVCGIYGGKNWHRVLSHSHSLPVTRYFSFSPATLITPVLRLY
jgi:hypothetical protein